jgi:methyl-accepting chemotaxis protein
MEEITRSFGAVAQGAQHVMEIAEDSLEVAQQGRGNVANSAMAIDQLASGTVAVGLAAEHLADVARDIDQVTYFIGSIAEQTKILALNAAIEAARAGEAGRGFSVVSTEIRKLADSVSESVNRIGTLVSGIQDASSSLAMTANQQAEVASSTVSTGAETAKSFNDILAQMERTAAAASEIAAAAAQQQAASRQIVEVMMQVSAGVNGAAASSRQLAESAGDVRREAKELHRGMDHFRR